MLRPIKQSEDVIDFENKINFTLVDPRATEKDLEKLCDIAYKRSYYSVCVNSCNVSYVKGYIDKNFDGEIKVVGVVGFPIGAVSTNIKIQELKEAIENNADEIEFVINIGMVKQGKFDFLKNELKKIRKSSKKKVVKAIIETCYLDRNELIKVSKLCLQCKIDVIKTSTGFGIGGATFDDVKLIYDTVRGLCKIEASGGIKNRESAVSFLNAGATRIATSHIV